MVEKLWHELSLHPKNNKLIPLSINKKKDFFENHNLLDN